MTSPFVSTGWLAARLSDPHVVPVDASWYLPAMGRDALAEHEAGHIPGAVFFPIDGIADRLTDLPHMLPSPEDFAAAVGALGIAETDTIVVYDEMGLFSAPRVWWSFRAMGARTVFILEGGGARWRAENRPLEQGLASRAPARFAPLHDSGLLADLPAMRHAMTEGTTQILDARPAERFSGAAPEPRPGLRSGHIPTSTNIPATSLLENGVLKPPAALAALFAAHGVALDRPIATTCGSGVTAATLALALSVAGAGNVRLYDGSWAEWGGRDDTPVDTGTPPATA